MKNRIVYEDQDVLLFEVGSGFVCKVDTSVKELIADYKWRKQQATNNNNMYVSTLIDGRNTLLHRFLLKQAKLGIDHKNGDAMDNRLENLREASPTENSRNRKPNRNARSEYKGVGYDPASSVNLWRARIRVNGRLIHLGRYPTEQMAAAAYNTAALQHFGEFARLNEGI
jgi:hypothetical protein